MSFKINEEIGSLEVFVIDEQNVKIGKCLLQDALDMAYQKGKDLVQISVNNDMPICQIIEYNKFRFMHDKKLKEIRRKQKNNVIKEVRLRPRIAVHDLEVKTKLIKDFLREGHKVRIAVMFKGREMVFVNQGREILETLKNNISAIGKFEAEPKLEGCCLRVTVVPIR